jgi:hypothetical protein
MSKKVRNFAIIILIIALIIGVLTIIDNSSSTDTATVDNSLVSNKGAGITTQNDGSSQVANDEFSDILASITGLDIDTTIFEDPSFKALRDFPIFLGTDTVGRVNPFAPIGSDAEAIFSGIQFQTIQPIEVTASSATLVAQINIPGNDDLTAFFEYGLTESFGTSTGPIKFTPNGTASFSVSELLPGKKYYVRSTLASGSDTIAGNTVTFTTKAK